MTVGGEGSPTYHYYPLRAMMLSAEALRCRNINLYDRKLLDMLASPAQGVYADLSFPAHNDGWYGESLLAQTKCMNWLMPVLIIHYSVIYWNVVIVLSAELPLRLYSIRY